MQNATVTRSVDGKVIVKAGEPEDLPVAVSVKRTDEDSVKYWLSRWHDQ